MNRQRLEKVNELIKREVGMIIQREFEHSRDQLITVTEVLTSNDLLHAIVRVSIWPEKESGIIFKNLKKASGFFQSLLNKKLKMHPVPRIAFEFDERVAEAGRVEELLKDVKNKEE